MGHVIIFQLTVMNRKYANNKVRTEPVFQILPFMFLVLLVLNVAYFVVNSIA